MRAIHPRPQRLSHLTVRRWLYVVVGAIACSSLWIGGATGVQAKGGPVVIEAPIEGAVDPVTREFVDDVLRQAQRDGATAVVFTMDTPGGLSSSMDAIVKSILAARELPVIVYVAPGGARAASAGVFIAMASDVAVMAPSTNIGSATPIQGSGQDISRDLRKKVVNDAVARMRTMAREHGRDEDFAEDAVRDARNIDEDEALERGVIEFVSPGLGELLDAVHGYRTKPKGLTLDTKDAQVRHVELPPSLRLLKVFIDPNVLFLLFSAGMLGLAFEITHPGAIFPGVVGAICLVVALFGFQVLPINIAGVVLLVLAFVLFAAEAAVVSHGVLGAGGAVSLFLGGLLLFERDSPFRIDIWLLGVVALSFAAFFGILVRKALAARRARVVTGSEQLVGARAVVRRALDPEGTVWVVGELWKACAADGVHAAAGTEVEITVVEGLTLVVRPLHNAERKETP